MFDTQAIATLNKIGDIENMTLTQDEWLASGITNAEAAEAEVTSDYEHAKSLIEKAIYCFGQANNDGFTQKAKIQLESFELRLKLFHFRIDKNLLAKKDVEYCTQIETKAASLMEKLLKQNLLLESKGLGRDLQKLLQVLYPSKNFFDSMLSHHLPGAGYTY